ncbi:hypothetical protein [Paractinoplanes rishiriensis]|nr:hypothetical protein [Actinoplanes rishiriensis]
MPARRAATPAIVGAALLVAAESGLHFGLEAPKPPRAGPADGQA